MLTADNPDVPIYPAWRLFLQHHSYAAKVAPTSLGLCGDNPPSIKPLNDNYVPAEGSFELFMSNERSSTAWYDVDPLALERVLEFTTKHRATLSKPEESLVERSEVLALAERWLEEACPKWLTGWRDVTSAHVLRTVIASVVPLAGAGNNLPLLQLPKTMSVELLAALIANLNSLTLDYAARHKVGGVHLNFFIIKQLPVFPPAYYQPEDLAFIAPRVLELTYTSHDMSPWALALGHTAEPFEFDPDRRAVVRAELDAYYARLYGMSRDELRYVLDPTDVMGEDYPTETFRVLKASEVRQFGEYRTRTLVLEAWDKLRAGELH